MKRRVIQIQDLIARELAVIFSREMEFPVGAFPSIIKVKVSEDLRHALVWIGVVPPEKRQEVLKCLNKNISQLQSFLNQRLTMKFPPRLLFKIDTTSDKVQRIEELVAEIHQEDDHTK